MNQIFVEATKLICSDGEVWLWKSESLDGVRHFTTKEDAQKYIELLHQLSREKGWNEESYSIGTEDDFMAHGMYGRVECRDTLRLTEPTVVYVINEVKYPFNTPYYSVRKILAKEEK